jgi:hypothetical protein
MITLIGLLLWLALTLIPLSPIAELDAAARLVLFAVLVVVPLALPLVAPHTSGTATLQPVVYRVARLTQPFAAAFAVVSFFMPIGSIAALCAAAWLLFTLLVAWWGLLRFLAHRFTRADLVCLAAGMAYLPVGGVWLVLSRLGANPLGFGDVIVLLTAVHFHYAGFALLVIAGMTGRQLIIYAPRLRLAFRIVAIGLIAGMALVATGITFTAVTGSLALEVVAVVVFAASVLGLSYLTIFHVAPTLTPSLARVLLFIAGAAPVLTMLLAAAYAVGRTTGAWSVSIAQMIVWHGWVNAIGFVGCGLLAWRWVKTSE